MWMTPTERLRSVVYVLHLWMETSQARTNPHPGPDLIRMVRDHDKGSPFAPVHSHFHVPANDNVRVQAVRGIKRVRRCRIPAGFVNAVNPLHGHLRTYVRPDFAERHAENFQNNTGAAPVHKTQKRQRRNVTMKLVPITGPGRNDSDTHTGFQPMGVSVRHARRVKGDPLPFA